MNKEAMDFAMSIRGHYIISQALHYGIEAMSKVESPYKEVSNINDMQYLKEHVYNFPVEPMFETKEIKMIPIPTHTISDISNSLDA